MTTPKAFSSFELSRLSIKLILDRKCAVDVEVKLSGVESLNAWLLIGHVTPVLGVSVVVITLERDRVIKSWHSSCVNWHASWAQKKGVATPLSCSCADKSDSEQFRHGFHKALDPVMAGAFDL